MNDLQKKLAAFVAGMPVNEQGIKYSDVWYVVQTNLPAWDFNREIAAPGAMARYPDGALGIRCDDDFWEVAILPHEYTGLSIQDLVAVLWPHIEEPEFNDDTQAA